MISVTSIESNKLCKRLLYFGFVPKTDIIFRTVVQMITSSRSFVLLKDGIFEIISAVFAVLEEKQVKAWFLSLAFVWALFMLAIL
jgi:hypothetical protein